MSRGADKTFRKCSLSPANARHRLYLEMARDAELLAAQGERIRELRARARKSQEKVAYEVGVSARRYRDWEAGRGGLHPDRLKELASYFGTTEDFIEYGHVQGDTPDLFNGEDRLARLERKIDAMSSLLQGIEATVLALAARAQMQDTTVPTGQSQVRSQR